MLRLATRIRLQQICRKSIVNSKAAMSKQIDRDSVAYCLPSGWDLVFMSEHSHESWRHSEGKRLYTGCPESSRSSRVARDLDVHAMYARSVVMGHRQKLHAVRENPEINQTQALVTKYGVYAYVGRAMGMSERG